MNILLVDDEPIVISIITKFLSVAGHTVRDASSGREALATFAREHFDMAITDLGMPEMDGLSLARTLKARAPALPVVLLTGSAEANLPPEIDHVLEKPLRLKTLTDLILRIAETRCETPASPAADSCPMSDELAPLRR